jgi:hypothetical protein
MAFDPRFVIDVIYPADNSAYMIMTVPAPPLGAGYALVGPIEADPRRAAAAMAAADPARPSSRHTSQPPKAPDPESPPESLSPTGGEGRVRGREDKGM